MLGVAGEFPVPLRGLSRRVQDVWALPAGGTSIIYASLESPKRRNQVSTWALANAWFSADGKGR